MNWDGIGAIAEMLGAIAVLISIVYLAIQVKQNTEENRILRAQGLVTANADANALIANNSELSEIVRAGMIDFDALSEKEQFRFSTIFFSFMSKYDFAYHQRTADRLDEKFWERTAYEIGVFINLPGANQWWRRDKPRFSLEFAAYVDELLSVSTTPQEVPTIGLLSKERGA
jgi:hypothetical protein